ncbi:MAG: hypothetical protein KGJ78_15365 [Alphaproteobacteria bacterium]|nr:hypothetical protein [Alphaproteobacteria bacterium]
MWPLIATLVSPFLLCLANGLLALLLQGVPPVGDDIGSEVGAVLMVYAFGLAGVLAFGWPSYLLLRRAGAANIWTAMIVGVIASWLAPIAFTASFVGLSNAVHNALSYFNGLPWIEVLKLLKGPAYFACLGAFTGASFWMIIRKPLVPADPARGD